VVPHSVQALGAAHGSPDYLAIVRQINRIELYRQAAAQLNVAVPAEVMRIQH
jgi:nitrate/nitrite transport system substrate-binding protein